jgi:hypothetical protein
MLLLLSSLAHAGATPDALSITSPRDPASFFDKKKLVAVATVQLGGGSAEVRCGSVSGAKTCSLWDTAGQEEIVRTTNILLDDNGHGVRLTFANTKPAFLGTATQLVIDIARS